MIINFIRLGAKTALRVLVISMSILFVAVFIMPPLAARADDSSNIDKSPDNTT